MVGQTLTLRKYWGIDLSSFSIGQSKKALKELVSLSREYGADIDFVVAGGGNTSVKIGDELWVKASGTELAQAKESAFVAMDRAALDTVLTASYPEESAERETLVKRGLLRAMLRPDLGGRPTVEASLHNMISYRFVIHTHPWKINALTCSKNGMAILARRFEGRALTVAYKDPGYTLAVQLEREIAGFVATAGHQPKIIFLGNHGLFVAADTAKEIRTLTSEIVAACEKEIKPLPADPKTAAKSRGAGEPRKVTADVISVIRSTLSAAGRKTTSLLQNGLTDAFCGDPAAFKVIALPFTPDQIVYCRSNPLYVRAPGTKAPADAGTIIRNYLAALASYRVKHGVDPYVVCIQGIGLVAIGDTAREARTIRDVFADALKVAHAAGKSGGPKAMTAAARKFIESWEVEKYRRSLSTGAGSGAAGTDPNMTGHRTVVVTGGAQGFGEGIVRSLFAEGHNVVIADLNVGRGTALAQELSGVANTGAPTPPNGVAFVQANVADEQSVSHLLTETVVRFGGCDVFISNAGVLRAGGLEEIDSDTFDFMTSVNFKGYFICAKYASAAMKHQFAYAPHLHSDIIQINSKSGLEGSNKNFTYAGNKFGGLGLTQSFALELIPHQIKVNSICPGNFLDGPLWSDPDRGLFVQYLQAGKVPGAKTTGDVRRAYEAKVPAGRGCTVNDVMRAIYYVIEQRYETGQAVPVTGGQIMLK
jgi:rhamnose utilization protein RhaD (predicted bifunctional aldolase and dehydrogenase)/NAD(P)-dependent dehydrogenase (short-subunit alcohol dehydrogenase family)